MENVVVVFIGFEDKIDERERLSNMLRMMGACVREEIDSTITHFISSCSHGNDFDYAQETKLPILKGEWVEASWDLRHKITWNFNKFVNLIETHKVRSLYKKKITFYGYNEEEEVKWHNLIKNQQGEVVHKDQPCTHVVVACNVNTMPVNSSAFIVTHDWLKEACYPTNEKRVDENEYLFNIGRTLSSAEKHRQIVSKLQKLEINSVRLLQIILELYKLPLDNLVGKDEEILGTSEIDVLFSDVLPLYTCHKKFKDRLDYIDANEGNVGVVFLQFQPEFLQAYTRYAEFFETKNLVLNNFVDNNAKFSTFLQNRRPHGYGCTLKQLLLEPCNRLIVMINLLTKDFTCENSPDYFTLLTSMLTCVSDKMNRTSDFSIDKTTLKIFTQIENCPLDLVRTRSRFFVKYDVIEIKPDGEQGGRLVLFIFNECLIICKMKSRNHQKPYEYIKTLDLTKIKQVAVVVKQSGEKMFALELEESNGKKIIAFMLQEMTCHKIFQLDKLRERVALLRNVAKSEVGPFLWAYDRIKDSITDIQYVS